MKFLKSLKINALVTAILYILIGLLFVLLPDEVTQFITLIVGVALVIAGIVYIIDYFRRWDIEYRSNGLAIGILLLFAALFLFLQSNLIVTAIPILLGFAVVVSGTIKLQNAIVLNKTGDNMWKPVLVLALVSLALGIVFMINPFATTRVLVILIGVGLMLSGLSDLVIIILMSRRIRKAGGAVKQAAQEAQQKNTNPS